MKRNFDEGCYFCGDPGHRRHECQKMTAALKARGLRHVDGQWVGGNRGGGEASSENGSEDLFYLNLLEEAGGGKIEALSRTPPPPTPTEVVARRPRQAARVRFCSEVCDAGCTHERSVYPGVGGGDPPSRGAGQMTSHFEHANP